MAESHTGHIRSTNKDIEMFSEGIVPDLHLESLEKPTKCHAEMYSVLRIKTMVCLLPKKNSEYFQTG